MSTAFIAEVVRRVDGGRLERVESGAVRCQAHATDIRILADALDDTLHAGLSLDWWKRAGESEAFDACDPATCFDPIRVRRELDEIERLLTVHKAKLPFYGFFSWTNAHGQPDGSNLVSCVIDGQPARLIADWDLLRFEKNDGATWVRLPLKSGPIRVRQAVDGPEREVIAERRSFLTHYLPFLRQMREVCAHAIEQRGLIMCAVIH
jgi:hypothetical protein